MLRVSLYSSLLIVIVTNVCHPASKTLNMILLSRMTLYLTRWIPELSMLLNQAPYSPMIQILIQILMVLQTRLFYPRVYVDVSVVIQLRRYPGPVFTAIVTARRRFQTFSSI